MKKLLGFSLVELLVGLVLTSFIVSGVTVAFITSQKNQNMQHALDEIQENAAMVFYYLKKNIRNAGVTSCNVMASNSVIGRDDEIEISKSSVLSAKVLQQFSNTLLVAAKPNFHKQDEIIISDCAHHEIIKVQAVQHFSDKQKLFLNTNLQFHYSSNVELKRIDSLKFFVKKTSRMDQWKNPIYALYDVKAGHRIEELVEGVRNIEFLFAEEDQDNVIMRKAAEVHNWQRVIGVEINLQLAATSGYSLTKNLHGFAALHKKCELQTQAL